MLNLGNPELAFRTAMLPDDGVGLARMAKTGLLKDFNEDFVRTMLTKVPRGLFVLVEEIAAMVAFCASSECLFTTGSVFDISGGRATY